MKFMVLCLLEPAGVPAPSPEISRCLANAGLEPVGSSRSEDGLAFGLPNAFVGEFRSPDAKTLEAMLARHLDSVLPKAARTNVQLVVQSLGPAPLERRRA
jgi:hypothetical protein